MDRYSECIGLNFIIMQHCEPFTYLVNTVNTTFSDKTVIT